MRTTMTLSFVVLAVAIKSPLHAQQKSPYPKSKLISSVEWDFKRAVRLAPGSDLWPMTWGVDGNLYTAWGDGCGFGGRDGQGRVRAGIGRITGSPVNLVPGKTLFNVNGGLNPEHRPTWKKENVRNGWPHGIVSIDDGSRSGVLWLWQNLGNNRESAISRSRDNGITWERFQDKWSFKAENLRGLHFVQFGRGYRGVPSHLGDYAYMTGHDLSHKAIYLVRAPKDKLHLREAYEFYSGGKAETPAWSKDLRNRKPIHTEAGGVGSFSLTYNAPLKRYLLLGSSQQNKRPTPAKHMSLFEGPRPWGPWKTVAYTASWGPDGGYTDRVLHRYIVTKSPDWLSADGKTIHMVWSGYGSTRADSFHVIKGRLRGPK